VDDPDIPVALRCSTIVFANHSLLLVHRLAQDDWVLPGGRPRIGEGVAACARREVREETGLLVDPGRVAFVLETISPTRDRLVELVFLSADRVNSAPSTTEGNLVPAFVPLDALSELTMSPPLAGHIRGLSTHRFPSTAPYLGNLWRPRTKDQT